MTFYAFLTKRPRDREPWPLIFKDKDQAESAPYRVSEVTVVELNVSTEVAGRCTCSLSDPEKSCVVHG